MVSTRGSENAWSKGLRYAFFSDIGFDGLDNKIEKSEDERIVTSTFWVSSKSGAVKGDGAKGQGAGRKGEEGRKKTDSFLLIFTTPESPLHSLQ